MIQALANSLTGKFVDKPTHRLVNSWTTQLAEKEFLEITEKLHYI